MLLELAAKGRSAHYRKNAILLALLPYGMVCKKVLKLLFAWETACSQCINRLVDEGLVVERKITVRCGKKTYSIAFLMLTKIGLLYLVEEFGDKLPWLKAIQNQSDQLPNINAPFGL